MQIQINKQDNFTYIVDSFKESYAISNGITVRCLTITSIIDPSIDYIAETEELFKNRDKINIIDIYDKDNNLIMTYTNYKYIDNIEKTYDPIEKNFKGILSFVEREVNNG